MRGEGRGKESGQPALGKERERSNTVVKKAGLRDRRRGLMRGGGRDVWSEERVEMEAGKR